MKMKLYLLIGLILAAVGCSKFQTKNYVCISPEDNETLSLSIKDGSAVIGMLTFVNCGTMGNVTDYGYSDSSCRMGIDSEVKDALLYSFDSVSLILRKRYKSGTGPGIDSNFICKKTES